MDVKEFLKIHFYENLAHIFFISQNKFCEFNCNLGREVGVKRITVIYSYINFVINWRCSLTQKLQKLKIFHN